MHLLPRALKNVRTHPFGLREADSADLTGSAPKSGSCPAEDRPLPHTWAEILAAARHRRAPHLWPAPQDPAIGALVRAYVLSDDEHTQALASPSGENQ